MRCAELHIEELKQLFVDKDYLEVEKLHAFYKSFDTTISKPNINWRIRNLVQTGTIQRTGRGKYKLGHGIQFTPQMTRKLFKVNSTMRQNFPYLKYIIWHVSDINSFSQHLVNKDICYVEVERDAVDAVFEHLRERFKFVLRRNFSEDVYFGESVIVVRALFSGSPIQTIQNVPTTTIEKLMVDLYCDKDFNYLQGHELTHLYNNAFSMFTVNIDKLLRYASRREKRAIIRNLIDTIK